MDKVWTDEQDDDSGWGAEEGKDDGWDDEEAKDDGGCGDEEGRDEEGGCGDEDDNGWGSIDYEEPAREVITSGILLSQKRQQLRRTLEWFANLDIGRCDGVNYVTLSPWTEEDLENGEVVHKIAIDENGNVWIRCFDLDSTLQFITYQLNQKDPVYPTTETKVPLHPFEIYDLINHAVSTGRYVSYPLYLLLSDPIKLKKIYEGEENIAKIYSESRFFTTELPHGSNTPGKWYYNYSNDVNRGKHFTKLKTDEFVMFDDPRLLMIGGLLYVKNDDAHIDDHGVIYFIMDGEIVYRPDLIYVARPNGIFILDEDLFDEGIIYTNVPDYYLGTAKEYAKNIAAITKERKETEDDIRKLQITDAERRSLLADINKKSIDKEIIELNQPKLEEVQTQMKKLMLLYSLEELNEYLAKFQYLDIE